MKRKNFALILIITIIVSLLVGCGNKTLIDTTYSFERAILILPNGEVIDEKVQTWKNYGDQIQVKIDEKTYLVHSSNIVLISE